MQLCLIESARTNLINLPLQMYFSTKPLGEQNTRQRFQRCEIQFIKLDKYFILSLKVKQVLIISKNLISYKMFNMHSLFHRVHRNTVLNKLESPSCSFLQVLKSKECFDIPHNVFSPSLSPPRH